MPFRRTASLLLVASAMALLTPGAQAKNRWYQVEVIVFKYTEPSTAELAVPPAVMPNYRGALSLVKDLPEFDDEPAERPNEVSIPGPIAYEPLARGELKTGGVYRRLRDLPAYDPVLHVGWRQPGGGRGSRAVYITNKPRLAEDISIDTTALEPVRPNWVEGTVRVRTGRLLHVETDFLNYGEAAPVGINERRKVKFRELHYFDNPFFGVIVQVTPYRLETSPEETEDTETTP